MLLLARTHHNFVRLKNIFEDYFLVQFQATDFLVLVNVILSVVEQTN